MRTHFNQFLDIKKGKKGQKKGETRPEIDQWEENTIIQNRISFSIILTDAG
jgi:hypothetical protein